MGKKKKKVKQGKARQGGAKQSKAKLNNCSVWMSDVFNLVMEKGTGIKQCLNMLCYGLSYGLDMCR